MSWISLAIRSDRKGFAIFLAMLLTILIVLMGIYLIDKLVPAAKDAKGVEHGNVAYYSLERHRTGPCRNLGRESGNRNGKYRRRAFEFLIFAFDRGERNRRSQAMIRNSEYDDDWNVISIGKPVQINCRPDTIRKTSDSNSALPT